MNKKKTGKALAWDERIEEETPTEYAERILNGKR